MVFKSKLFLGPVSKNIVDVVIEEANQSGTIIGLIPSRRQVDFNNGYVNAWNTKKFVNYVRSKSKNILIVRDHSGPLQGISIDDGVESLLEDTKCNFNMIHVDPWKKYPKLQDAIDITASLIQKSCEINDNIFFEIGTEEAIRPYSSKEFEEFIYSLKLRLKDKFNRIKYAVIQTGNRLEANSNIGSFNKEKSIANIKTCKEFNLLSKEHNGDYLEINDIRNRFIMGLDSINIAPEFGYLETKCILNDINSRSDYESYEKLFNICFNSRKWVKWIPSNKVDIYYKNNKNIFIETSCHYLYNKPEVKKIIEVNPDIHNIIKDVLRKKIKDLLCAVK